MIYMLDYKQKLLQRNTLTDQVKILWINGSIKIQSLQDVWCQNSVDRCGEVKALQLT